MVPVVVHGDAQQALDVEDAVRGVGPVARPAGVVERPDRGDRRRPDGGERRNDRLDRGAVIARRQARLGPRPVGVVLHDDPRQAGLPDLALDGDEVAHDLGGTPLAR